MTPALPLFPLGTVLFPGLVLPLHVFEERYRALVRDLLAVPDGTPREFGVVAISSGWEVEGGTGAVTFHDIGCTAELRQVTEHPDGRFDLVTVGRRRFAIDEVARADGPYLRARVSYLAEPDDDAAAEALVPRVLAVFRTYLALVRTDAAELAEQLPEDPTVLSHLIAATASLTLTERQALLAAPETAARLRAELAILQREVILLRQVRAVPLPVSELPVTPGPN
ncbi:LON peptidase substrate-binding domain-containing protein [Luedemannella flava]|uniref:LON peptidase substrate-binding domain-containing protein n=1 Tax=Luedemannella flava TaxID=349316 RepID=A0ABP4Y0C7_9ACTN